MNLEEQILNNIKEKGSIRAKEISQLSGLSKQSVVVSLKRLIESKKIARLGQTNHVRYVLFDDAERITNGPGEKVWHRRIERVENKNESAVFGELKESFFFKHARLSKEVTRIIEHAFTEMLNNAIEHSGSEVIEIWVRVNERAFSFEIVDRGVGIFNNIKQKRKLENDVEAAQDIFKGKQTTMPATHSGQGIFFTSKMADKFWIISNKTEVLVDNTIPDFFIKPHRQRTGTLVGFLIAVLSPKKIQDVFNQFTDENLRFNETKFNVNLYAMEDSFVSRSQARRLLAGLDEFKRIVLDFNRVEFIGQGFADEIFRVYKNFHPDVEITFVNTTPEVEAMIRRAMAEVEK